MTRAALVALILALQPVSAAFNPVVTLVERALGLVPTDVAVALVAAQIAGGVAGAVVATSMFDLDAVSIAGTDRTGGGLWLGEVVATLGLVLVIFGALRSGRTNTVAFAVAGYITAAYWFTSSTSFANPAVTVARMFSGPAPGPRRHPGDDVTDKPTVLFVCVHNAGRSQMAAGYLQHLSGDRIEVLSAGSAPADAVHPAAVQAMAEEGIDLSAAHPKVLTDEAVQTADVVITMGCGDACPFYPGKRYEDWELEDPAGQGVEAVRPIRDEIKQRVARLIAELVQ